MFPFILVGLGSIIFLSIIIMSFANNLKQVFPYGAAETRKNAAFTISFLVLGFALVLAGIAVAYIPFA